MDLRLGDCLDVLATLDAESIDACVSDPPYHLTSIVKRFGKTAKTDDTKTSERARDRSDGMARLSAGFMGKQWDGGDVAFRPETWTAVSRVLKPGAYLLAFGGTRTYHRLAVAIEDAGFEIRDTVMWVYGSGFPKSHNLEGDWEGWGTALKPAWEPIVVARKPLGTAAVPVRDIIEHQLRELGVTGEIRWSKGPVKSAARSSQTPSFASTKRPQAAGMSASPADASAMPSNDQNIPTSSDPHGTDGPRKTRADSESYPVEQIENSATKSSMPMAESARAAESLSVFSSPSTISTAAEQSIERPPTGRSMVNSDDSATRSATESFAGIATGLTGSMAHVHINKNPDGSFAWPDGVPVTVAARSLTVAENVAKHGTGAINIDGCRVGEFRNTTPSGVDRRNAALAEAGYRPSAYQMGEKTPSGTPGRWPANLIHDGSDEVLAAFPAQAGAAAPVHKRNGDKFRGTYGAFAGKVDEAGSAFHGDSGSAARFFYCAKASRADRNDGDAKNNHPTVKPTELMRYLCRLVTPPGGTVLDPFMGSGSTGRGAALEGFDFIGIEKDPDYMAIARARIAAATPAKHEHKAAQYDLFGTLQAAE